MCVREEQVLLEVVVKLELLSVVDDKEPSDQHTELHKRVPVVPGALPRPARRTGAANRYL